MHCIYYIQRTHFTKDLENSFRSMWRYESYFYVSSNSRGAAILFNNNFVFKLLKEIKDTNGNYLILKKIVESQTFL